MEDQEKYNKIVTRKEKEYIIITIISDQNLTKFQDQVHEFTKDKYIKYQCKGASMIPASDGVSTIMMAMPYCYIEWYATEEQYRIWKFGQSIKLP